MKPTVVVDRELLETLARYSLSHQIALADKHIKAFVAIRENDTLENRELLDEAEAHARTCALDIARAKLLLAEPMFDPKSLVPVSENYGTNVLDLKG
jgi:hypothetical protein